MMELCAAFGVIGVGAGADLQHGPIDHRSEQPIHSSIERDHVIRAEIGAMPQEGSERTTLGRSSAVGQGCSDARAND
jgi:hypothetical protein